MSLNYRGCFDLECCGDAVFGYDGDCTVCGTNEDFEGSIDASDLYDEGIWKHVGEVLYFTCEKCKTVYKTTPKENDWIDDLELEKVIDEKT